MRLAKTLLRNRLVDKERPRRRRGRLAGNRLLEWFSPDTYDFDAEDLDGDGDRDLLLTLAALEGNRTILRLLVNEGERTLVERTAERFDTAGHDDFWIDFSFVRDLDADGALHIVADDWGTRLSWLNENRVSSESSRSVSPLSSAIGAASPRPARSSSGYADGSGAGLSP